MNRIIIFFLFLQVTLIQLSGCSIARYPTEDISKNPKAIHMEFKGIEDFKKIFNDVNTEPIPGKNAVTIKWSGINKFNKIEFDTNKTSSIKYHRNIIYQAPHVNIKLELPNGRKHPVFFDTGFNGTILFSSDIALENKLEIYPSGSMLQTRTSGICIIPELNSSRFLPSRFPVPVPGIR